MSKPAKIQAEKLIGTKFTPPPTPKPIIGENDIKVPAFMVPNIGKVINVNNGKNPRITNTIINKKTVIQA